MDSNYTILEIYEKSVKELERIIKETNKRPNEENWNRYAVRNGYLSSESIGYICGIRF